MQGKACALELSTITKLQVRTQAYLAIDSP